MLICIGDPLKRKKSYVTWTWVHVSGAGLRQVLNSSNFFFKDMGARHNIYTP